MNVIPDEAVHIPGFNLMRKDRPTVRGGGVAIYLKNTILFKIRDDLSRTEYECLWITLRPKWLPRSTSKIVIACVYLPPLINADAMDIFMNITVIVMIR